MPGKGVKDDVIQLVYYNYYKGKNAAQLSEMFNIKLRTIYNIINRAEKEGRLELKTSNGRPKKLSEREERTIIKKINETPKKTLRRLVTEMENECEVKVCSETIRKTLLKNNYLSKVARKKPLLSRINVEKRLLFAQKYINFTFEDWENVIFCDETKIMLYYNDGPTRVWQKPLKSLENKNIIPTVKHGKFSVMVWGCISSKGVGNLVFIDGKMDKNQYLDILKNNLESSAIKFGIKDKYQFYQDNDPKHKLYLVRNWLLYNCPKVLETPAQSPDLNPIENVWAYFKRKVASRCSKNKSNLVHYIKEEWANLPEAYDFKKLIASMNNRLQGVVNAKGEHIKY